MASEGWVPRILKDFLKQGATRILCNYIACIASPDAIAIDAICYRTSKFLGFPTPHEVVEWPRVTATSA